MIEQFMLMFALSAGQAYKCTDGEAVVYQDRPCETGEAVPLDLPRGPALSSKEVQLIEMANRGRVMEGMSADQVRIAWGKPDEINRSVVAGKVHEQWVYRRANYHAQYVYLEDNVVTAWQNN